jgi:hypothetical protein
MEVSCILLHRSPMRGKKRAVLMFCLLDLSISSCAWLAVFYPRHGAYTALRSRFRPNPGSRCCLFVNSTPSWKPLLLRKSTQNRQPCCHYSLLGCSFQPDFSSTSIAAGRPCDPRFLCLLLSAGARSVTIYTSKQHRKRANSLTT